MSHFLLVVPNSKLFSSAYCAGVALEGNLPLLKLLRERGFDWDARTCQNAALRGHLELLKVNVSIFRQIVNGELL